MNFWVPRKVEDLLTSWATVSFSRRTLLDAVNYKIIFIQSIRYFDHSQIE
jgi:hypothetical protein